MVRDSEQSVAMLYTTWLLGQAISGKGQQAVSGNTLDHLANGAGPSVVRDSKQSVAIPPGYLGGPSVVRDKEQSVAMP